ncbi:unnamed protein product [Schistocephalus solidus]|uniref:Reverse transcriptase domain-containing protein n=1 Tax=Schistocephalus solidus TaxID=70667 RepID=A0A183TKK3_SCHSO|nr:unnamed protein product [Schistocephalus solidus]
MWLPPYRVKTAMICFAGQLQQTCQAMQTHIYTKFVDLTKAFQRVNRNGMWNVMQKFRCPERFTHIVCHLHDGMMERFNDNGTVSETFAVTNGVKKGCVLALNMFSLLFSAMLIDEHHDEQPWIRIAYRTHGYLLNCLRMQVSTYVSRNM